MKKIIASAGLVAVSAIGLKAQNAPGLSRMETAKPWSVSAALRGFYDDNYFGQHKSIAKESFGLEVKPRIAFNLPRDQTYIGGAYTYSLKWYENRDEDPLDHSHEAELKLDHRFSERFKIAFNENFVYAQEPDVIEDPGSPRTNFRTDSNVFRNRASVDLNAQASETFGVGVGYENGWYDYQDERNDDPATPLFDESAGTRSALLDRLEHLFRVDGRWQARPDLTGILGYQFRVMDYTGDELLSPFGTLTSEDRNSLTHFVYLGAEYTISEELSAAGRVGVEYTEYTEVDSDEVSPYADISGTYRYVPGSHVQLGFRHERNPTDIAGDGTTSGVTLDQETSTIYGNIHHRITARVAANVIAQYQHSTFNGGGADNEVDNFFLAGLNLQYEINQNWTAEAGYNYDRLDSDVGFRSFSRNRVYAGVRLQY